MYLVLIIETSVGANVDRSVTTCDSVNTEDFLILVRDEIVSK